VIPPLFTGLCDDAALFPPGDAPVSKAVPAHRGHRSAWYAELVGPFLATPRHFAEVADVARATETLVPLILVVPDGPAALGAAVQATMGAPGVELVGVELACGPDGSAGQAANTAAYALARELLEGVRGTVEVRRGQGLQDALDVLASMSYRAKFRTGGTASAAFPTVDELAGFIVGCAARKLPFKCTAGLHGAARHTDPLTGFEHHGFLNILAATDAALRIDKTCRFTRAAHLQIRYLYEHTGIRQSRPAPRTRRPSLRAKRSNPVLLPPPSQAGG